MCGISKVLPGAGYVVSVTCGRVILVQETINQIQECEDFLAKGEDWRGIWTKGLNLFANLENKEYIKEFEAT